VGTKLPGIDFAALARSMGCEGTTVERPADLATTLRTALAAEKAWLVDVKC
jgi:benzoylformate decarboxylase